MTDEARPSVDDVLAQAGKQFLKSAEGTLRAFDRIAEQLAAHPDSADLLTPLRRELHRLNGSAATFGFPRVSRMAAALEGAVRKWSSDPMLDRDRRAMLVARFVGALREEFSADAAVGPSLADRRLLLVGLKDAVSVPLTSEASARGFRVERVEASDLADALEDGLPHAIIAAEAVPGLADIRGVPRIALRRRSAPAAPGPQPTELRMLDLRTEPVEVLDALEVMVDTERVRSGGIVAVDDDPVMCAVVRVACEQMNLAVTALTDPDDFRASIAAEHAALAVIDVEIGAVSGLELVEEVRADPRHEHMSVLVLSGRADAATRDAAFKAGADDYMLKPFAPAEFQQRVGILLETQRRRLAAQGVHAASRVSLPARTTREFETEIGARARLDTSIAVLAPPLPPASPRAMGRWYAECGRIGRDAAAAGGTAGLLDDITLGVILPMHGTDAVAWLTAQAGDRGEQAPAWVAGVVEAAARGPDAGLADLLSAAREAHRVARDSNVPAREWEHDDGAIAPDVIVIEDDVPLADLILFALETKGLSHRHFTDGIAAVEALRHMRVGKRKPLVLLDLSLPGLDGHSLHDRLRSERPGAFDVVFFSARGGEADQLRALQAGALDYLVKPVSLRVLTAKVAAWRGRGA